MTNFMKLNARSEMRLGEYAMRLVRIESHIGRGELRAARARIAGLADELEDFRREIDFPVEMVLIGSQLGLLSGKGSLLRGRLPGVILGGVAGWFIGHSLTAQNRRYLDEIVARVTLLEIGLAQEFAQRAHEDAPNPATTASGE